MERCYKMVLWADRPQLQTAYRLLLPWEPNSQHQSDKLSDGVGSGGMGRSCWVCPELVTGRTAEITLKTIKDMSGNNKMHE